MTIIVDYPCSFCGWIDGEHADGCPYEDHDYLQDVESLQEKESKKSNPKYPEIEVQLSGNDGNAFFILGTVSRALRKANLSEDEIKEFNDKAMSGDYDNLLQTCMKWVTVS